MATAEAGKRVVEGEFSPYRMTVGRYERACRGRGYTPRTSPIFLWKGRLVQKIRDGFLPTPDGDFPERRMTVDRFIRLVDAGVFTGQDRVFLWHGSLVEKMTDGDRHAYSSSNLASESWSDWSPWYRMGYHARDGSRSSWKSTRIRCRSRIWRSIRGSHCVIIVDRPPTARDVALVIEVSESSLRHRHAGGSWRIMPPRIGIPIYWIVNLVGAS